MTNDIILDALGRVHELVPAVLKGLIREDVLWRPDGGSNSIGWLIWHLTRVEDDHLASLSSRKQVWETGGFREKFNLPYPESSVGFGMSSDDVAKFDIASSDLLIDYATAVAKQSHEVIAKLAEKDFAKIIDCNWNPPVTVAARLVSVMVETAQHIGQAAYVRGLRERAIGRESGWRGYV